MEEPQANDQTKESREDQKFLFDQIKEAARRPEEHFQFLLTRAQTLTVVLVVGTAIPVVRVISDIPDSWKLLRLIGALWILFLGYIVYRLLRLAQPRKWDLDPNPESLPEEPSPDTLMALARGFRDAAIKNRKRRKKLLEKKITPLFRWVKAYWICTIGVLLIGVLAMTFPLKCDSHLRATNGSDGDSGTQPTKPELKPEPKPAPKIPMEPIERGPDRNEPGRIEKEKK